MSNFVSLARKLLLIVIWCGILTSFIVEQTKADEFQYRAKQAAKTKSVLKNIKKLPNLPADAKVAFKFENESPLFFDIRFGTAGSTRVLMAMDIGEAGVNLYVDSNRDRRLELAEQVKGTGKHWTFDLDAEWVVEQRIEHLKRTVSVNLNSTNDSIGFGTIGYCEGKNRIGDRILRMRCTDANANGLFGESEDQIWIDLNQDQDWDPFSEQFSYKPVIRVDGQRYSIKSDRTGRKIDFERLTDTGNAMLSFAFHSKSAKVDMVNVILIAEDDSVFPILNLETVEIPVGKYTVDHVRLSVRAGANHEVLHFVFSQVGKIKKGKRRTFEIRKDQLTKIDPLGQLQMGIETSESFKPGKNIVARARLRTEDGLLINSSHVGGKISSSSSSNFNVAKLKFAGIDGKELGREGCGFN